MTNKKFDRKKAMDNFLENGGKLTEEQWKNMSERTRATYVEEKEKRKTTIPPADKTGPAKRAGLTGSK